MTSKTGKIVLLFALIISFVTFPLYGCSSNNSDKSSEDTEEKSVSEKRAFDLGGRTIKIGVYLSGQASTWNNSDSVQYSRIVEAEGIYNCKIEWKQYWKTETISQDLINIYADVNSGTSEYDIIQVIPSKAFPYILKNIALPLDNYIDFKRGIYSDPVQNVSLWNGKHYGLSWDLYCSNRYYILYNKTMLESQGLGNPLELMLKDQWDWDTFLKIAKSCTRDTDGDGQTDVWGILDIHTDWLFGFITANNGTIAKTVDGREVYSLNTKESIHAVDFYLSLYKVHKVARDSAKYYNYANSYSNLVYDDFTKKYVGAFYGSNVAGTPERNFGTNIFETVMYPKGPDTDKYISYSSYDFFMIPASVENPEQIASILSLICSVTDKDKAKYNTFDLMCESFINSDGKYKNYIEMIKIANKNITFSPYNLNIGGTIYKEIWNVIKDNIDKDAKTILEELKVPMQQEIDKIVN